MSKLDISTFVDDNHIWRSMDLSDTIKVDEPMNMAMWCYLKMDVFRRTPSVVLVMRHFLKLQSMLLANIIYKQISIWTLVTAVTTQTSRAPSDFALYYLEDLTFIRTCTQGISITWLPLSVVRK
jgi:hypothetical protein